MTDSATTIIWRFSDGKAGHDAQSRGLSKALSKQLDTRLVEIDTGNCTHPLLNYLIRRFPAGENLPDPDLIVGAGHRTHWPMLAARRARGGKVIVLMKPSLPVALFDYCLIPEHDSPPAAENIIKTLGALNEIESTTEKNEQQLLIMVGGPSRHFDWDNKQVATQIVNVCRRAEGKQIIITASPRTPDDFHAVIRASLPDQCQYLTQAQLPRQQLLPLICEAKDVWVTMDSVSMIYEALTAGARVGLIELTSNNNSRVVQSVGSLVNKRKVMRYGDWLDSASLPAPTPMNEAQRCAEYLLEAGAVTP